MTSARRKIAGVALAVAAAFGLAIYAVHAHTRDAYRAVGINDGRISQQEELLNGIRQSVSIQNCAAYDAGVQRTEFLTVKAETLYLVKLEGANVQFCQ